MNKKGINWLYEQLPDLISKGILSLQNAEDLKKYYGEIKTRNKLETTLIICSIFGALLIGLGIILLLAHNWDDLSRPARTLISLMPLITAQVLAGKALLNKDDSLAWKEGTAAFLTLSIGSSIALISQTYNIPGDTGDFLLTWSLLTIPIVYIFNASVPAFLYLAGVTAWSGYLKEAGNNAFLFWPAAALAGFHFLRAVKEDRYSVRTVFLSWTISICVIIAAGTTLEGVPQGLWIVVYGSLFAVLYSIGALWFNEAPSNWQRPFQNTGVRGIFILSLILSFRDPWKRTEWDYNSIGGRYNEISAIPDYLTAFLLFLSALIFLNIYLKRRNYLSILYGTVSVVAVAGYLLRGSRVLVLEPNVLFNVYLLVLGSGTIYCGIKNEKLSATNEGMFIISAWIIARFFDSEMGFVSRGLAFIFIGIGFLTTNVIMIKQRKQSEKK